MCHFRRRPSRSSNTSSGVGPSHRTRRFSALRSRWAKLWSCRRWSIRPICQSTCCASCRCCGTLERHVALRRLGQPGVEELFEQRAGHGFGDQHARPQHRPDSPLQVSQRQGGGDASVEQLVAQRERPLRAQRPEALQQDLPGELAAQALDINVQFVRPHAELSPQHAPLGESLTTSLAGSLSRPSRSASAACQSAGVNRMAAAPSRPAPACTRAPLVRTSRPAASGA